MGEILVMTRDWAGQLALAGEPDTAHPFFWAPFVLGGDGGSVTR